MLNDNNDKYKMCPVFNHIISREPMIGDYIITTYGIFIVQDLINEDSYDDNGTPYIGVSMCLFQINDDYFRYSETSIYLNIKSQNYIIISKELYELILEHIIHDNYNFFNKIISIITDRDEELVSEKYIIYMMLYHFYTYINSIITDDMDKMILLSFGIKKILKKHKNNGFRDVLLGNGQIWRLKKKKIKGMRGRLIAKRNEKNKNYKLKSVHYNIVKRLL